MAFAEQDKVFVNFTGGLNTEATPLNFPENTAEALDNFDLFITGEVKRRLGIDFETSYIIRPESVSASNMAAYATSTYEWKSANGSADLNFLVVQIGLTLYFHNLGSEPLSETLRGSIDLSGFKTGGAAETRVLSIAHGEGILLAGNSELDPVVIEYDEEDDEFTATRINIEIRDFEGIEEDVEDDHRPTNLTGEHEYNLRNQGWPEKATVNKVPRGSRGVLRNIDPVSYTRDKLGVYPSNSDIFHAAKAASAVDAEVLGTYSPWSLEHNNFGNTPAPKGHFILDAFNQFRVFPKYTKETNKRPRTIAFYAGRAWFAGVPDTKYTGEVYFSQILNDPSNAGKCYQSYDPTAEDLNALLATDGGVIHIADLGEVYSMTNIGADLVIVSNNGVWAVSGAEAHGNFTADSFSVRKISDQGAIGRQVTVTAEGSVMWWGEGGIWAMSPNETGRDWRVDRITRQTIQTYYDSLSTITKAYARVFYDSFGKKVYWLYNDTDDYSSVNFRFRYNRALVLDTSLGSFYTYTFEDLDENTPWVSSMLLKTPGSEITISYDVVQGEDDVVEGGDDVVQDVVFESFANIKVKFLTFVQNADTTYSYTFSELTDTTYHDWKTWDQEVNDVSNEGANFDSFIQTGWQTYGDLMRDKTITHVASYFNRTEDGYLSSGTPNIVEFSNPSSAMVQVRWDFTDIDVGRWTRPLQAYRLRQSYIPEDSTDPFDYGYTVVSSKLRMRGKGTGFGIRYYSEEGKDLQLIGFAVNVRAGAKI